jgi:HEAT repeat protein
MAVTMEDVRKVLAPDEPNYARARQLGPDAIPFLRQLVMQGDLEFATKAAHLAGLIGTEAGATVVGVAAGNLQPVVRVAAATAAGELEPDLAGPILSRLLDDSDRGVRRQALRSAAARITPVLRKRIEQMFQADPDPLIRNEANTLLRGHR